MRHLKDLEKVYRRFGLAYCLHFHVLRTSQNSNEAPQTLSAFEFISKYNVVTNFQTISDPVRVLHKNVSGLVADNSVGFLLYRHI
jgi:hypothetical protein